MEKGSTLEFAMSPVRFLMARQMPRFLLAFAFALMLVVAPVIPSVAVAEEWSDDDPVVVVVTPKGNLVPVFNTMGVYGVLHVPSIALANVKYTTKSVNGGRATKVTMDVTIPNDLFGRDYPTRVHISSGPMGTLETYAKNQGNSGKPMRVEFTLDVP